MPATEICREINARSVAERLLLVPALSIARGLLERLKLMLVPEIQRSLAVRSVTTPFALAAAKPLGGQPDLVALFVVVTGVFGMAVGDVLFLRLSIREGMAKGAGFGAASHGAGTARSYELGPQEGVIASLVMMLSGVVMVLAAPLVRWALF